MLTITVPETELFDEANSEFVTLPAVTLSLEHSLVSLARWESKWEQSFLSTKEKTLEQTVWYVIAMTLDTDIAPEVYSRLTNDNIGEINAYIDSKMTATTFNEINKGSSVQETVTAELIYYWMIALQVPFECETWHLNRLLTLIKVVNIKNQPAKKMSQADIAERQRRLNAERMAKYGTTG